MARGRTALALALVLTAAGAGAAAADARPDLVVGPATVLSEALPPSCTTRPGLTAAEVVADAAGATATWLQGQDSRRLGKALASAVVVDGAVQRQVVPGHDLCGGGPADRQQFPDLSAGPQGVRWAVGVGTSARADGLEDVTVRVSRSRDAGRTWSAPGAVLAVVRERQDQHEPELAWVVGSPTDPGTAVVLSVGNRGSLVAGGHLLEATLLSSRTTDGGRTWSAPAEVMTATAAQGAPLQVQAQVLADGSLGAAVTLAALGTVFVQQPPAPVLPSPRRVPVVFVRSTDGGTTWSAPVPVLDVDGFAVQDPRTRTQLRFMPHPGLAQTRAGDLLVAAEDDPGVRDGRVLLARSRDLGRTWQAGPVVRAADGQVLQPTLARDGKGRLLAAWYELSDPDDDGPTRVSHLAALSRDDGATWSSPTTVAGPALLDALVVPYVAGVPSVAADGNGFAAVSVVPPAEATAQARGTQAVLRRLQPTG